MIPFKVPCLFKEQQISVFYFKHQLFYPNFDALKKNWHVSKNLRGKSKSTGSTKGY